jgi:hypothetical protein
MVLRIHQKWLNFDDVHRSTDCEFLSAAGTKLAEDETFYCDHILHDLLEAAVGEIRGPLGLSQGEYALLRKKAARCLRQMPRCVKLSTVELGNALKVS